MVYPWAAEGTRRAPGSSARGTPQPRGYNIGGGQFLIPLEGLLNRAATVSGGAVPNSAARGLHWSPLRHARLGQQLGILWTGHYTPPCPHPGENHSSASPTDHPPPLRQLRSPPDPSTSGPQLLGRPHLTSSRWDADLAGSSSTPARTTPPLLPPDSPTLAGGSRGDPLGTILAATTWPGRKGLGWNISNSQPRSEQPRPVRPASATLPLRAG